MSIMPTIVLEQDRFGGGSVTGWAGIRHHGRTALVSVNGYTGMRYCSIRSGQVSVFNVQIQSKLL